ncbi:uncharacterized protein B0H18DRAFT_962917 [Fomitopsis serialis]|uniref:uncharacterized protein n=1 Tax=Fomitopsis serialis TaxID=139415 RepID=UPI0020083101|nr:uncharacterized protein B0H18DRAFT_962917 [Neoantrodia serialis]KAH9910737.1 hypothetical protein B0H18DRAFT_962917 [Neoantrodia serialis]
MSTRTPAAGTSFVGDAKRPLRSASVVPSGSTTPFTPVSAPSPGGSLGFYGAINPAQPPAGPPAPSPHSPVDVWTSDFSRFPSSQPSGANTATLPRPFTGDLPEGLGVGGSNPTPYTVPHASPRKDGLFYARSSGRDAVGECHLNLLLLFIGDASSRKNAIDKIHLRDLLDKDGKFKAHLRRPDEAQRIYLELNSPDVQGRYRPLFEECNALVCKDVDPDDIVDSKNLDDKDGRFYLAGKQHDRVEYVTEGMESLVAAMLRLEGENQFWKVDHAESLTKALSGASSRGMISDAYRTVQYRVAKVSTLIHQRLALHGGYTYPRSVRSTASDFSNDLATSVTKRAMVDKWLRQPDIFPNLTPEYQAVVQHRLSDSRENEDPASLAQVPPELRFKILPGSLLTSAVILNASMTQDYDVTGAGSLASPERVEQELTHGVSQSTAEPSVPPKRITRVRLPPPTVDTRPRYTQRSSYGNPTFELQPPGETTRRVQFQEPPSISQTGLPDISASLAFPTQPFSAPTSKEERRSSGPHPRGHSRALPDSSAAQAVRDAVYPNGVPPSVAQPSQANPSASTNAGIYQGYRDLPPHLAQPNVAPQAFKGPNGDHYYVYQPNSAGYATYGGNRPPTSHLLNPTPSPQGPGSPGPPSNHSPSYPGDANPGGGPPFGGPPGGGGDGGGGGGGGGGSGGGGGGPEYDPYGGGPPGGGPPPDGGYSYGFLPGNQPTIIIHHTPAPRELGVRLDQKISRDSIPEWDGRLPTILVYLHKMNNLANKNEYVARDLGAAAPDRFTGRAESWWQMLGLQHQQLYSSSWWALYQGIKIQFFTHKFLMALRTHYDAALMAKVADKTDELIAFAGLGLARSSQYEQVLRLPTSKPDLRFTSKTKRAHAADSIGGGFEFDDESDPSESPATSSGIGEGDVAAPLTQSRDVATAASQGQSSKSIRGAGRKPPRGGHQFKRDDSVKSKVCGSPYHWDRDCPHWNEYDIGRNTFLIGAEYDCDKQENEDYEQAFVAYICSSLNNTKLSSALWTDIRQAEGLYLKVNAVSRPSTRSVTIEEEAKTLSQATEVLPLDPHYLTRSEICPFGTLTRRPAGAAPGSGRNVCNGAIAMLRLEGMAGWSSTISSVAAGLPWNLPKTLQRSGRRAYGPVILFPTVRPEQADF